MGDYPVPVIETAPPLGGAELSMAERRQRWFEVCLVLVITCGGSVFSAIYFLKNGIVTNLGASAARWSYGLVHQSAGLLLLGYVLSRRGLGFKYLGLRWSLRGVGVGLLVAGASFAAYFLGALLVFGLHYWIYGSMPTMHSGKEFFGHPSFMFIPFCFLNPFFEELIVRAYLITEVIELTRSKALAVAISVVVQFSYHLYYRWVGAISLSFLFLSFALYYVRSRRALPIIVGHALFDFYALIRVW